MKNNNNQNNKFVLEGLCLKCFYLNYESNRESFSCAKYEIKLDGIVESCPAFMAISEGLGQLIAKMKEQGELPEWVGSKYHIKQKEF